MGAVMVMEITLKHLRSVKQDARQIQVYIIKQIPKH